MRREEGGLYTFLDMHDGHGRYRDTTWLGCPASESDAAVVVRDVRHRSAVSPAEHAAGRAPAESEAGTTVL